MPQVVSFPGRFAPLADHYAAGRPAYPTRLLSRVAELTGLAGGNLLDIGTGPGFLAIGLAPYARAVSAIDPEPEMLRVARTNAREAGHTIDFVQASSHDLSPEYGRFRLVTIGRAFHWMDRADTLARLDRLVEPDGAVVLFSDSFPRIEENAWHEAFEAVLERHSLQDPAKSVLRTSRDHEGILLDSPFSSLERIGVIERRTTPLTHFVKRALSYARVWSDLPSTGMDGITEEVLLALVPYTQQGVIQEVIEGEALIARRA